ncbi:Hypothetical predicted protein [Podarcis lilfordi]|uniref:Uncharacterized protein n=1 Tax=Podarcis lilfordi TaxID=74358 RepID=A0AA35KW49_9SAUR|nr:Hypothetical predicted protein [Podarcis lilfordi]
MRRRRNGAGRVILNKRGTCRSCCCCCRRREQPLPSRRPAGRARERARERAGGVVITVGPARGGGRDRCEAAGLRRAQPELERTLDMSQVYKTKATSFGEP